jgi:hypothetical protein
VTIVAIVTGGNTHGFVLTNHDSHDSHELSSHKDHHSLSDREAQ